MRYYLFFKRNEILICANMDESWQHYVKWKEPEKKDKYCMIPRIWVPRIGKFLEAENRIEVVRGWREK